MGAIAPTKLNPLYAEATFSLVCFCKMKLGNVVKSNSHCDYIVQLDDSMEVSSPPLPDEYGFGSFVKLETHDRHWAIGLIYNSQLFNPAYLNTGPRLVSQQIHFLRLT